MSTIKAAIVAAHLATTGLPIDAREARCMADVIYYESRGEPLEGMIRVGQVVLNRMRARGLSACKVIAQPNQFPWKTRTNRPHREDYATAVTIAVLVLSDDIEDISQATQWFHSGASSWFSRSLLRGTLEYVDTVGQHHFYR